MPDPGLVGCLRVHSDEKPHETAYEFLLDGESEGPRLSFRDLDVRARAVGSELERRGLGGRRALLLFPPGLDFISAFLGCLLAGVVAVPTPPPRRRGNQRLRSIVEDCEPAVVLGTRALVRRAEVLAAEIPFLRNIPWLVVEGLAEGGGGDWQPAPQAPSTVAFLQYTSGSTATPKGVMVSHQNLLCNEAEMAAAFGVSSSSRIVSWLPLYHDMGLIGGVLQPLFSGASCVLFSPVAFLQRPVRWLQAISRHRATISGAPDFAYDLCTRRIQPAEVAGLDLSSWQVAFSGAEPVRARTLERFAERFAAQGFARRAFYPCYGLAEATLFVAGGTPGDGAVVEVFSSEALAAHRAVHATEASGKALVGCGRRGAGVLRIVDPASCRVVEEGEVGEIWLAGESIAQGYWNRPEHTAETFEARCLEASGETSLEAFLRTGDLGFLHRGDLFISGRLKDLIILRGRNLYPQDIEATAQEAHADLRLGGGIAFSVEVDGEERLVVVHEVDRRAVVSASSAVAGALRRAVAQEHEAEVYEVVLIRQGTLPKTSSGKLQRRLCRRQYLAGELQVVERHGEVSKPSAVEMEEPAAGAIDRVFCLTLAADRRVQALGLYLRQQVAAAMRCPLAEVPSDEPLMRLLLDSLRLVDLVHRVSLDLGVTLDFAGLFEGTTLAELAEEIAWGLEQEETALDGGVGAVAEEGDFALSLGQEALWFVEGLAGESGVHHLVVAARVEPGFEPEGLRRALELLVARHGALRTTFHLLAGEPVRRVHRRLEVDFAVLAEAVGSERLGEEARRPFDLSRGPLVRVRCFEGEEGTVVLWVVHHLIVDFWSLKVLAEELATLYRQAEEGIPKLDLPPLETTYEQHVAEQREVLEGASGEALRNFWLTELAGASTVLGLPTDHPRPRRRGFRGAAVGGSLDAGSKGALEDLARSADTTLFSVLLATFQLLLARLSGREEVLVGAPTANRRRVEMASVVGYLVNPVVLRGTLRGAPDFARFLRQVGRRVEGALAHQEYPFAELARQLGSERAAGHSPVVQALFVLQRGGEDHLGALALGVPGARVELGSLVLHSVAVEPVAAAFDLSLHVAEVAEELHASLIFDRDLFDRTTAQRIFGQWRTLLAAVMQQPTLELSALAVLSPAARHQLLVEWQAGDGGAPAAGPGLHRLFEAVAARRPQAPAVVAGSRVLTYGELNRRANHLACNLVRRGAGAEERVGVLCQRTPELVLVMMAVLKAGAAYVPLDPAYPRQRLGLMVADSATRWVLTDDPGMGAGLASEGVEVLPLSALLPAAAEAENLPQIAAGDDRLAYLIYTSGSTGRPKGVAIPHRPAVRLVRWAGEVFPELAAEVLAATSVCFDLSIFEIFGPLSHGGTVVLVRNALELPALPTGQAVGLVNTVPSALDALLAAEGLPASVATVNLAGEALERRLVERIYAQGTVQRVFNLYGPSECTTYATWSRVAAGNRGEPAIGRPVGGSTAHVLSSAGREVPVGVAGELFLGGAGLARGYFAQPAWTAERFVPDAQGGGRGARLYRTGDLAHRTPSGELMFLGRRDHQVKIRGFRIEPGEIEQALVAVAGARAAVVLARGQKLWGFVVAAAETTLTAQGLRASLGARLPAHLVPEHFVVLESLPRTANGKVDRAALDGLAGAQRPVPDGAGARRPRSPVEEVLAEIWQDLLALEEVGIGQNFFDLGGHSLLGVRMISRVRATLGIDLPLAALFEAPTIERLAAILEEERTFLEGDRAVEEQEPEALPRDHPLALSFAQERLWFLDQLALRRAVYNMPSAVRWRGVLDVALLDRVLAALVGRHEALRTVFVRVDGAPRQHILPPRDVSPQDVSPQDAGAEWMLPQVDLRALPGPWRRDVAVALAGAEGRRPFDLEVRPARRFLLLTLGEEEHLLLLTLHHMVADGASLQVLWGDLASAYQAGVDGVGRFSVAPAARLQSADFAVWQRRWAESEQAAQQRAWWRRRLQPLPAALELPTDRPRPPLQSFAGGLCRQRLATAITATDTTTTDTTTTDTTTTDTTTTDITSHLEALTRRCNATLFMTVLAGFQAFLQRLTGQRDFAIGVPVAGRDHHLLEGLVGLFVNTLVLPAEGPGEGSFEQLLGRVRKASLEAFGRRDLPFEQLVEALEVGRDASRNPLFQAMLAVQQRPAAEGLPVSFERFDQGVARLDLTLFMERRPGGLELTLEYSADLFDGSTARRLLAGLCRLLHGVALEPQRALVEHSLLSPAEERQLLSEWNDLAVPALGQPLHRLFAAAAERTPERVAVVWNDQQVSYGALRRRVVVAAGALRSLGVGRETRVGIALERSPRLVVALLAVLEAGGAYVPLDPAYPAERLAFMVQDSGASLVVGEGLAEKPPAGVRWLPIEDLAPPRGKGRESSSPATASDLGDLAYVIYTSGSTGRPKGVALEHGSAAALVQWAAEVFSVEEWSGVLASTSICFDLSIFELFGPLSHGGTVVLVENALALRTLPGRRRVRLVNTVPSAADGVLALGGFPASVRTVNLAGEALSRALVQRLHGAGVRRVLNLYGPSECTTYSTWSEVPCGVEGEPTIGRPLAGSTAYVLDARGRLLPPGVPGTLFVGGAGVARGYFSRAALTAERFLPDPFIARAGGRLYDTGDGARWRAWGELEYLGRRDQQVKVRGFRIELGEIETVLGRHPAVRAVVVVVAEGSTAGGALLVAHGVADETFDEHKMRDFLASRLPVHMLPTAWVAHGELPTTPNGKIDRRVLARQELPQGASDEGADTVASQEPVVEALRTLFGELLGRGPVGAGDDFFALGGHSLLATRLLSLVRRRLAVELPISAVFEAPTAQQLARRISLGSAFASPPSPLLVDEDENAQETSAAARLSFAQERLWFLAQLNPGDVSYNMPAALRLTGTLRLAAWQGMLDDLQRRHSVLRTRFPAQAGRPRQELDEAATVPLALVDLSALEDREARASSVLRAAARQPFDIEKGPLLRALVIRLADHQHLALLTMHHIISDGWSMGVLLAELAPLYGARATGERPQLEPLPLQVMDVARWQRRWLRGEVLERQLDSWRQRLAGRPAVLELPTDRPRPAVRSARGERWPLAVSASQVASLEALGQTCGATLFMTLLAAFQILLARLTGRQDVLVGTPIANRRLVEFEPLIGFFANTLVLRGTLTPRQSGGEIVQQARWTAVEAYLHQDLPFELLVEDLEPERQLSHNPLFQVLLVVQNEPLVPPQLPQLEVEFLDLHTATSKLDLLLNLEAVAGGGLRGYWEYDSDLFDASTVGRLAAAWRVLLAGLTAEAGRPWTALPVLPRAASQQLLREWNDTATRALAVPTVVDLFETAVPAVVDRIALEADGRALSYGCLDRQAAALAHGLGQRGVGPDVAVALEGERRFESLVAVLAVLKAGGTCLPLDASYPAERLAWMRRDAKPLLSLKAPWLSLEAPTVAERRSFSPHPKDRAAADHLAYVIYTSGSTGRPKGVALPHRTLSHLVRWQLARWGGRAAARTAQRTSLSFDVSFQEIFTTWCAGGTLILVSDEVRQDPPEVLRWVTRRRLERLFLPFVALRQLALAAQAHDLFPPALHQVITAGEQLQVDSSIRQFFARSQASLCNQYGPSESHVVTDHALAGGVEGWPTRPAIGRPIDDSRIVLADAWLRALPVGGVGEVLIAGASLARGYLGQPALTAAHFLPDPFAGTFGGRLYRSGDQGRLDVRGEVEFLGRLDEQIKVRGLRVELGEIETTLRQLPAVRQAVVVQEEEAGADGERRLVAWLVVQAGEGEPEVDLEGIREVLERRLPGPMVPTLFARLDHLPLTPSGKVDRRDLARRASRLTVAPGAQEGQGEGVAPSSVEEEILAGIWCDLLRLERVGIHENFFTLGGHSLLATQLIARLLEAFGVEIPLRQLFEGPTIAALAEALVAARAGGHRQALPPFPRAAGEAPVGKEFPLSFAQERLWFLEQLTPGLAAYHLPYFARLRGRLQVAALEAALETILRRHDVLRATFGQRDAQPFQVFAPAAACPLPLIDLSALPSAVGQDESLHLARAEARRPFDLARGPLLRPRLVRLGACEHLLLLNQHHIVSDGWSREVLQRELVAAYGPGPGLDALPLQYTDYAAWQRRLLAGATGDALVAFWRRQLEALPPLLQLPTDRPRPAVQSYQGSVHHFRLSASTAETLGALGRKAGATLFMTLLAGVGGWLERLSGQRDVVIGTPVANRRRRQLEDLIGLFVNTLALRLDLRGDPALLTLLPRVREMALASYAHQDLPFERLVETLAPQRSAAYSPIFQVFFALQNSPTARAELPGLTLEALEVDAGGARFDLALVLWPLADGGLGAALESNRDLFDATTVARMAQHLVRLLEGMVAQPERPLADLPLLSPAQLHQLTLGWNDTAVAGEAGDSTELLHSAFLRQVRRRPAEVALVWSGESLTYGDLGARVEALAGRLAGRGVGPGEIVGLAMGRCPEMVIGLLAVLVAGAAYLPLDPTYPAERLVFMVDDAQACLLLVHGEVPPALRQLAVPLVDVSQEMERGRERSPRRAPEADHLAYVIYTSGSTGRPKGVMVSHRNGVNFALAMERRIGRGAGTWLALTSMSFDISVLELVWTLGQGFRVVLRESADGAVVPGEKAVRGPATLRPWTEAPARGMEFSLFYFASEAAAGTAAGGRYRLLLEGARFADRHGFTAVWTPERHFHAFGGLYPNPSVTGAALATITENLAIRAGSVVLPLHDPVRVAEEWAVVDNLSNGRAAISFATGWHADDFIFAPQNFVPRKSVMERDIETVRALWRGESVTRVGGAGQDVEVRIFPQPVQKELPIWYTAAGNVQTFSSAGQAGTNLLTHLLGQSVEELGEKISVYRRAWREAGHGGEGTVTVMLHTFVGEDLDTVRQLVREPFCQYLKSASFLIANLARSMGWDDDLGKLSAEELDILLGHAFERYFDTSGLLGTPQTCLRRVQRLKDLGVDEVACLIDFGVDEDLVLHSLEWLEQVRQASQPTPRADGEEGEVAPGAITHLQCTPSQAMVLAADSSASTLWRDLQVLLLGGESLSPALVEQLRGKTSARIHNMYGPTETTIWSTCEELVAGEAAVFIGRPLVRTHLAVLDRRGGAVPVGVAGELLIGGLGVTQGYLRRPALTAARFLPDPSGRQPGGRLYRTGDLARRHRDGRLEFLGRTDQQVKVLGHRIELGEIEALLGRQPGVREAAVAVHPNTAGEPRLVAYLRRAEGSGPRLRVDEEERQRLLAGHRQFSLPNGMVVAHHDARQAQELYREVFDGAMYDRYGVTFEDGDCIFDIGANTGFFTMFVSQQCEPGKVYAFEPIPNNFEILRTNVALYGGNAQAFPCGVAKAPGSAAFTFYPNIAGLSSRFADTGHDRRTVAMVAQSLQGDGVMPALAGEELDAALDEYLRSEIFECPLMTLSQIIREQGVERIDVLKIDVEGSEIEVLEGIEEADWPKIGQFVLEVHSDALLAGTRALLEPRGFDIEVDEFLTFEAPSDGGNGGNGGNDAHEGKEATDPVRIYMLYAVRPGWRDGAPSASSLVPGPEVLTAESLRRRLAEHLPAYMVPASFVFLDDLPRTPNGKLDRRALRAPEATARALAEAYVAPRTETERRVAEVWREVLGVDAIGVGDNFFEAGGTSLTLVQASRRLEKVFQRPVPLVEMFRHPTVLTLAAFLNSATTSRQSAEAKVEKGQERARKQAAALEQPSSAVERQRAARQQLRPRGRRRRGA